MKEKLITLIDKTEEIETLFHKSPSSPGVIVPVVDMLPSALIMNLLFILHLFIKKGL